MSIPGNGSAASATLRRGADPHVDGPRLLRRLAAISRFGARPGAGITRTGLGPVETAAREFLARECRRDGLTARTDEAGNLIVRRPGADPDRPVLLIGSHIDTVTDGGRYDGTYGVLAACEVLRVLVRHGIELPYEPVAVAFTNEEGAFFP